MKKKLFSISACLLPACIFIAFMFFCLRGMPVQNKKDDQNRQTTKQTRLSEAKNPGEKGEKEDKEKEKKETTDTLMIYMVGSDLESRSGAGTDDLKEIEESGIDFEAVNVLVYTGGSTRWHNDSISKEKNHILHLTEEGFKSVAEFEPVSMGTAETLSSFLNYCSEQYAAEQYGLIMWNHGNGPVIGYGKDMLFDNDSLTLSEMQAALSASPFNSGNKLSFVGFDACLMSSAELACTWENYADYLVASQEVEPSFGWNYDVFGSFGTVETESFLKTLVDGYLSTCVAYYEEKGYGDRDTTLSCINLSFASELRQCLNNLFAKAALDVESNYNMLALKRVETRALGRASTGSEYDLIDLNDMAAQLSDAYPEEAKALQELLQKMIVKNGTNAENCCGMSLYYPFYNKYYYENSWQQIYADLGAFESYGNYLDKYQQIWLKSDKFESYASSATPQAEGVRADGLFNPNEPMSYTLELTPEQHENYADAKFYILKCISNDLYQPVVSSERVVNDNGTLRATFSGKGIYVRDAFNDSFLPVAIEHDMVEDVSRYTVASTTNSAYDTFSADFASLNFHLSLDNRIEELSLNALLPRQAVARNEVVSGKLEEYSMEEFLAYTFTYVDYRVLTRNDKGTVLALADWFEREAFSAYFFYTADQIEFVYSPLSDGQYYFIFEITDTQGSKYCSEPLPIKVENPEYIYEPTAPLEVYWNEQERVKLFEQDGIAVYMRKGLSLYDDPSYTFEVENDTDGNIQVNVENIVINNTVQTSATSYFNLAPNETIVHDYGLDFQTEFGLGAVTEITELQCELTLADTDHLRTIARGYPVKIHISGEAALGDVTSQYQKIELYGPYLGALAEEQVLLENEEVRVTLLQFGEHENYTEGYLRIDNLSARPMYPSIVGINVSGISLNGKRAVLLYPGHSTYMPFDIYSMDSNYRLKAITDLTLVIGCSKSNEFLSSPDVVYELPVTLTEKGTITEEVANASGQLIFDKNDVQIFLNAYGINASGNSSWNATVFNNSNQAISVDFEPIEVNGYVSSATIYPGQNADIYFTCYEQIASSWNGTIYIMDADQTSILFASDELITLPAKPANTGDVLSVSWEEGEKVLLLENDEVAVYLQQMQEGYTNKGYILEAVNKTNHELNVTLEDVIINGNIATEDSLLLTVPAGATGKNSISEFRMTEEWRYGEIDEIHTIEGKLEVQNVNLNLSATWEQELKVLLSPTIGVIESNDSLADLTVPYLDAVIEKQVVFENEKLRVALFGIEKSSVSTDTFFAFENLTDEIQSVGILGWCVNDVFVSSTYICRELPPGCTIYKKIDFSPKVSSIESLSVYVGTDYTTTGISTPGNIHRSEVQLKEKGKAEAKSFSAEQLVYDHNGVQLYLEGMGKELHNFSWVITAVNRTERDVHLSFDDIAEAYSLGEKVNLAAGTHSSFVLEPIHSALDGYYDFDLTISNFSQTETFSTERNAFRLPQPMTQPEETIRLHWQQGDNIQLVERDGLQVCLEKKDGGYAFKLQGNTTDDKGTVVVSDIIINGNISLIGNAYKNDDLFQFISGKELVLSEIEMITSIEGILTLEKNFGTDTLTVLEEQPFSITLSDEAVIENIGEKYCPMDDMALYREAVSHRQNIYEDEIFSITYIDLQDVEIYNTLGYVCYENKSAETQYVCIEERSLNGVSISNANFPTKVPPGCKVYGYVNLYRSDMKAHQIDKLESIDLTFGFGYRDEYASTPQRMAKTTIVFQ
ncbi:MAG: hypothetical protein E7403_02600 [Ruminococcaceae bacterium]|nr:hypothetical protein [Oscillospiraceae bacterium]